MFTFNFRTASSKGLVAPIVAMMITLTGCGNGMNFNKIWGSDDKGLDSLMAQAKIHYDKGNFDKAEGFAKQAYDINNENEEAAVLLGYIYLSIGGIDPFALAKKLVCSSDSKSTSADSTKSSSCSDAKTTALTFDSFDAFLAEDASASSSASSLSDTMATLISISAADRKLLGIDPDAADSSYFSQYGIPVYTPTAVTDELRAKIPTLNAMNQAAKYVCPFVASGVLLAADGGDPRDASCKTSAKGGALIGKSHFLWALTHMTEAVIFQSVLLYSTTSGTSQKSNLEQRSDKLNNFSGSVVDFVSAVGDLQKNVEAVFAVPASGGVTQLSATVNALTSVSNAFSEMAGLPESMKGQITKSIKSLQELGKKIGDANGTSAAAGQSNALKAQMTEKMGTSLKTTIDKKCNETTPCSAEETASLCKSYDSITTGTDPAKLTKPSACS